MPSPRHLLFSLLLGLAVAPALAQEGAADPLLAVEDADPLDLARVVARLGDEAVLTRLGDPQSADVRLAAIRATPSLTAPEHALGPLAEIAAGRDPDLAPAAAMAALEIAERLSADDLVRRETERAIIDAAIEAMRAIGNDESCRRDIRRAGLLVADRLSSLLMI